MGVSTEGWVIISPAQMRMARAAMGLSLREMGPAFEVSAMAISRFERGDCGVMSVETLERIRVFFLTRRVFFGPADGVCLNQDVFSGERWLASALWQLLTEAGIKPSSSEIIAAGKARGMGDA